MFARYFNLEMMPGIFAVTIGISILTWLLLRLMDSIILKLKQNAAERRLILTAFFIILICYSIRIGGSLVVYFLHISILNLYINNVGQYLLFATCYWLLVEFVPICFLYSVHYKNFSAQVQPDEEVPDEWNRVSNDVALLEIDGSESNHNSRSNSFVAHIDKGSSKNDPSGNSGDMEFMSSDLRSGNASFF